MEPELMLVLLVVTLLELLLRLIRSANAFLRDSASFAGFCA
jgi:hypothetical protein